MTKVRFIANLVQDTHKQNIACVAGDLEQAHQAGVEICRRANTVKMDSLAEVVIVSPGGAPRDKDLYQAQKALSVGEVFAKKEGSDRQRSGGPVGSAEYDAGRSAVPSGSGGPGL